VVQTVKHLPATRDTWVQSLDQEDPLEKEMGEAEDETVIQHHQHNVHEFRQTPGDTGG